MAKLYLEGSIVIGVSGAGTGAWDLGEYATHAILTSTLPPSPALNEKYARVVTGTGVWLINRKPRGWYRCDGASWNWFSDERVAKDIGFTSLSGLVSTNVRDGIDEVENNAIAYADDAGS